MQKASLKLGLAGLNFNPPPKRRLTEAEESLTLVPKSKNGY
jgi:hypothetical protein